MKSYIWKSFILSTLMISAICGKCSSEKTKVCVIGAGVAGLVSAKYLSLYPEEFEPIVFEKQSDVGGNWIYTDSTTVDEHGLPVHSSVYKNLKINFPKELEAHPDMPRFGGDTSLGSYVHHTQMLQYLQNYTEKFNLRQYIQLSTLVEKVSPLPELKWLISSRDLNTNKTTETKCDAVVVANGNNFKGHIPNIPGIDSFPGRVIHSHVYRHPEEFANQTVIVLGASFSGVDITQEISPFAKKVYLSHRDERKTYEMPSNVEQVYGVVSANGSELILSDNTTLKADSVILCTGYDYVYEFLDESSGIVVAGEGKYVKSVYKHLINIKYPTMAILNIPIPGLPFLLPRPQVAYFIDVLQGKIKLPSYDNMMKDAALPANVSESRAHFMLMEVYPYYQQMAKDAGSEPLNDYYLKSVDVLYPHLINDPFNFRKGNLHVSIDGSVEFY